MFDLRKRYPLEMFGGQMLSRAAGCNLHCNEAVQSKRGGQNCSWNITIAKNFREPVSVFTQNPEMILVW